jgi:hypothetical protein
LRIEPEVVDGDQDNYDNENDSNFGTKCLVGKGFATSAAGVRATGKCKREEVEPAKEEEV